MAKYVLIENNTITEYHNELPKNWRHVSGLNLSANNEEYLNSLGWYTVNVVDTSYDDTVYFISDYSYSINDNKVYAEPILTEKTIESSRQPNSVSEDPFELKLFRIREIRNNLLTECDYVELPSIMQIKGSEFVNKWLMYRQELRDLPNKLITQEYDINNFNWPIKP